MSVAKSSPSNWTASFLPRRHFQELLAKLVRLAQGGVRRHDLRVVLVVLLAILAFGLRLGLRGGRALA
eukprot:12316672-Alexandrium_andersonii.AAC.1